MTSNSKQMTLEELIVQRIKSDTLMSAVGDEDMLTKLAEKAVHELLLKPRKRAKAHGWGEEEVPSPVSAAAVEVAEKAAKSVVEKLVNELAEDNDFRNQVINAVAASMPKAIDSYSMMVVNTVLERARIESVNSVQQAILNKKFVFPS